MDFADARRFIRHVALPEVGVEGQRRILEATVALVADPEGVLTLQSAVLYLASAGVRTFRLLLPSGVHPPSLQSLAPEASFQNTKVGTAGSSWAAALLGCDVALRASLADDSFVEACRHLKVPAVVAAWRAQPEAIDLLSFRPSAGATHTDVPSVPPSPPQTLALSGPLDRGAEVLAGTLAATEVLWALVGRDHLPPGEANTAEVIRHLNVPFSTRQNHPITHNIPWPSA